ncbi:MAG: 3-oxoacyl-ACP synthase III [Gemmatimonadetes bacterium]|nr:MAG: 3-oxoacyl-ACP synthase III [Gemmatimonadota bacterium]
MRYQHVCIETLAYELPPNIMTSAEIERRLAPLYERLRLPEGRLELMSGVRERRLWNPGTLPSAGSIAAGRKALEKLAIPRDNVQCLIHASVCRDFLEPATATVVHSQLDLPQASMIFDVSNACLGVINGMLLIANMIELGQIPAGMVVAGETAEPLVEGTLRELLENPQHTRKTIKDSFASLTIGSGAVAVVLTHESISKTGHRLLGGVARGATQHNDLCRGGTAQQDTGMVGVRQLTMQTDSEELLQRGVELAAETWHVLKSELGWTNDTPHRFFCHQVGIAHRRLLYEKLELDMNKDFATLEFLGNVGTVSMPITLAMGIERGLLQTGQLAGLLGIGSGINSVMMGIKW